MLAWYSPSKRATSFDVWLGTSLLDRSPNLELFHKCLYVVVIGGSDANHKTFIERPRR
jgi:hypothetical protein